MQELRRRGGKGEMTKTPISLQDLRRRIYVKAKAEPTWRFWGLYATEHPFCCSNWPHIGSTVVYRKPTLLLAIRVEVEPGRSTTDPTPA
jgi:hypothetical protein